MDGRRQSERPHSSTGEPVQVRVAVRGIMCLLLSLRLPAAAAGELCGARRARRLAEVRHAA